MVEWRDDGVVGNWTRGKTKGSNDGVEGHWRGGTIRWRVIGFEDRREGGTMELRDIVLVDRLVALDFKKGYRIIEGICGRILEWKDIGVKGDVWEGV